MCSEGLWDLSRDVSGLFPELCQEVGLTDLYARPLIVVVLFDVSRKRSGVEN